MIILLSHSSGKLSSVHSLLNAISSVERLSSFNFVKKEYGMESGPTEVLVLAFARDSLSSLRVKGAAGLFLADQPRWESQGGLSWVSVSTGRSPHR